MKSSEFLNEETTAPMAQPAATAGQQFVGTGSSRDWTMSDTIATANATSQMIKQKYGNRPPPGNGIELKYYNKQQKTIADPAKPGNYLTTVTFTPIESKLSPAISVKPSMDPNQDFDYFYNGQQVKPGDAFFDRIKQIHSSLGAGDAAAQPEATTNETAELDRILRLSGMEFIAEDSPKSITVQRGDTLGRIALDNSTTVAAIVKLNNIANPDRIYPGDVIRIPGGQGDSDGIKKRQGAGQSDQPEKRTRTTTSTGNAKIAMEFFLDQGWTPEQTAGLVANLQAESYDRLDPAALGDKGRGYGIAQWHGVRQQQFKEIIGVPLKGSSLEDQLKFVQWELTDPKSAERSAGTRLKSAKTAADAAAVIDEFYERSSGIHRQRRIAKAEALLTAFA
jgi:LysM repeat protein